MNTIHSIDISTAAVNNSMWSTIPSNGYSNSIMHTGLAISGDADIKIGNMSVKHTLEKIEERLCILRPNLELESRWQQLRDIRKAYTELESEIYEKEKMWGLIQKS